MKVNRAFVDQLNAALFSVSTDKHVVVLEAEVYRGPSPVSDRPVIVFRVDAPDLGIPPEELARRLARRFPAAGPKLASACKAGPPIAGAAAALGSCLLSDVLDLDIEFGASGSDSDGSCWVEYLSMELGLRVLESALLAVAEAACGNVAEPLRSSRMLATLDPVRRLLRPNPESLLLIKAAKARDIPFLPLIGDRSLWQFGWGERGHCFWEMASNDDGMVGFKLSRNKIAGKKLFRDLDLPTPAWRAVRAGEDAAAVAAGLGWPRCVKPVDRGGGKGVTADIRDGAAFVAAVDTARRFSDEILVEEHQPGDDHRLTMVGGKLFAVTQRRAPSVVGDGKATIAELVAAINTKRQMAQDGYLKPVSEDAGMDAALSAQGLARTSVLSAGARAVLRTNANHSTGGTLDDLTSRIHPRVKALAEELASAYGLSTCGIDYITPDIALSPEEAGGFIEINATPGIRGMSAAGFDEVRIASAILGERPGRIPVTLILAPEANLPDVASHLAATFADRSGAGMATPTGSGIGADHASAGKRRPHFLVEALLRRPTLSSLTVVWSAATLTASGLPVDRMDRTVLLGPALDEAWMGVLRRLSKELVEVDDLEGAVAAAAASSS